MQYPQSPNRAARDHEALRQSACDIRSLLSGWGCACVASRGCGCLLASLDAFHRHVNRHFELEEEGWSKSGHADWTSRRRIHALMREHESIRARMAAVLASIGIAREMPLAPELATEIRSILDELLQHELSETGLFQSRVLGDRGLGSTHLHPRRNESE